LPLSTMSRVSKYSGTAIHKKVTIQRLRCDNRTNRHEYGDCVHDAAATLVIGAGISKKKTAR